MFVYLQLMQCNSMLVYVYPQRLCNCCAISGQNVSPGTIMAKTTAWPVWLVSYGRTQPQAFQVPAPHTVHGIQFQYRFEDTP